MIVRQKPLIQSILTKPIELNIDRRRVSFNSKSNRDYLTIRRLFERRTTSTTTTPQ